MNIEKIAIENIKIKLQKSLNPSFLEVTDESSKHSSHNEQSKKFLTHVKISLESELLDAASSIENHKLIYKLLSEELANGLHSIEIKIRKRC